MGGYLTDLFSWHWRFLINVVPGIVVTVATLYAGFEGEALSTPPLTLWDGMAKYRHRLGTCVCHPSPGQGRAMRAD